MMENNLFDMHCHVGFLDNPAAFAEEAATHGMIFFSNTVSPAEFDAMQAPLGTASNVRIGVGLHPWWLARGDCDERDADAVCERIGITRYVGEIGLDFGKRNVHARELQVQAFERIATACAAQGGKLLSIHAVQSADTVLDILESTDCFNGNDIIFHWFSGSSDALWRAIRHGCYFSISTLMLASRRGREYAKLIPEERLLLETDWPAADDPHATPAAWEADLTCALSTLEEIRRRPLRAILAENSARLLEA